MKYGLIGEKLGHSFSKTIHESLADYEYELKEIPKESLDSFMKEKSFLGINVTIPYKSAVLDYLDYVDETAEKIGAVNTVVNRDGKLYGYNTDFGGLKGLIEKQGFDYKNKKVLILGTGGTSKTAAAVAESLSAGEVHFVSRKGDLNYENAHLLHPDTAFIINTTPCGMYPDNFSAPICLSSFKMLEGVTDVVYNPLKTELCLQAQRLNIPACTGLYMLVLQAVLACERFTGKKLMAQQVAQSVYSSLISRKMNIVLIGMPGSGKTTIGKFLSEKMQRDFVDTDELITKQHGVISDIFSNEGEKAFRDYETAAVKEASKLSGVIIATGGGAILREENIDALRQNGLLFFLNRSLNDIVPTDDRPLSSDYEALKKRFEERYDKYVSAADFEIHVDGIVENSANKITEKFNEYFNN